MVLPMTRPTRHPTTGIFQFRKRVPDRLKPLVGKTEEKISLGTRDPEEAKRLHAEVALKVEARWRQLAAGPQKLSHRQAEEIAGNIYRAMMAIHEEDPDQVPGGIGFLMMDQAFVTGESKIIPMGTAPEKTRAWIEKLRLTRNDRFTSKWLADKGLLVDDENRAKIRKAVDRAVLQAREQLHRMAKGDYRPDPDANRFPTDSLPKASNPEATKFSYAPLDVFDEYAKRSHLNPKTVKKWRPYVAQVQRDIADLRELTTEWVIDWRDRLLDQGLDPKYVRESHIAALRAMCGWAVDNKRLTINPASGIKTIVRKQQRLRPKGYTDEEAKLILGATLQPQSARLGHHHRMARRWIPWLCAYNGARVGEMGQLRKQDIQNVDGVWLIWITPEAGTTKDGHARNVPIHPHLIAQGFLEFVSHAKPGPLFYDPSQSRGGTEANAQYRKVGERLANWVRNEVGITDQEIQPNHAWRHRFTTISRRVGMDRGARQYMQGHAPANVGEDYGDFEHRTLFREISKLPIIDAS